MRRKSHLASLITALEPRKEYSSISLTEQQTLWPVRGKSGFIGTRDWPDIGQLILIHCLPKIVIILLAYY